MPLLLPKKTALFETATVDRIGAAASNFHATVLKGLIVLELPGSLRAAKPANEGVCGYALPSEIRIMNKHINNR